MKGMGTHPKVFGIGFHKTATTSLGAALRRLGYRHCPPIAVGDPTFEGARSRALGQLGRYDAFEDNPWPLLFEELDRRCPGSRFVLTLRPLEEWIASVTRHFGTRDTRLREWIYGVGHPVGNEAVYLERHRRHVEEVRRYFQSRPDDLLVLRITEGEGWPQLCRFLGHPIPIDAFPRENSARRRSVTAAIRALRRIVR